MALTPEHDSVLALLGWLPEDAEVDAALVADLLGIPEAEALRLLDELEATGCLTSAVSPLQESPANRAAVLHAGPLKVETA